MAMTLPAPMDIWRNRFPLKHAADLLSISAIALLGDRVYGGPLDIRQRLACLRFYFTTDNVTRLHACLPRAGSIWSELGMRLAIDLAAGGDGEYTYEKHLFWPTNGLAYRRLDWRVPAGWVEHMYPRTDAPALDSTLYFQSRHPYFRIRSAQLKTMRTVVLTRSIFDSLESRFFKLAALKNHSTVSPDDDRGFDWDGILREYIAFFNSWGDVLSWHPTIRHYKYEDLKSDPVGLHKEILDFWGFDVPIDCVAEGFRRASKSEMRKRMPAESKEANIRAVSRSASQRNSFSPERKQWLIERLNRDLIHPLGYTYDENTKYGCVYD